jgi:putative transposase
VPRLDQRAAVAQAIRTVFDCPDRLTAQARLKEIVAAHVATAPKLAAWMEENLPQGLAIFAFPAGHQRRLRTSNPLERVNMELKRRTRVKPPERQRAISFRSLSAVLAATAGMQAAIFFGMDRRPCWSP